MSRITRSFLEAKVRTLNSMMDAPMDAYRTVDGKAVANIGNFHISGAYGGFCLHRMSNDAGGVSDVFSTGHIPARELAGLISAYMAGIYDGRKGVNNV